eukprot:594038-Prymnesium_polylepis.1
MGAGTGLGGKRQGYGNGVFPPVALVVNPPPEGCRSAEVRGGVLLLREHACLRPCACNVTGITRCGFVMAPHPA